MESEEEDGYNQANEELLRFLNEQSGGGVPHNMPRQTQGFDAQRERREMLMRRVGVPFLQDLAGALGLNSIEELYDRDDIDLALREKQLRAERRQAAQRKHAASQLAKKSNAKRHRDEYEQTAREYALVGESIPLLHKVMDVANNGHTLVTKCAPLLVASLDLQIIRQDASVQPSRVQQRTQQFCERRLGGDGDGVDTRSFVPLQLFDLYLDLARRDSTSLCHRLAQHSVTTREAATLFRARATIAPHLWPHSEEIDEDDDGRSVCEPLPTVEGIEWQELSGKKAVFVPLLRQWYHPEALRAMATEGCSLFYAGHANSQGNYVQMVTRYIFAVEKTHPEWRLSQEDLRRLDILHGDEDGQPSEVAQLLQPFSATLGNEIRTVLLAHFVWCYFERAPMTRVATDWATHGVAPQADALLLDTLTRQVNEAKLCLAEYISLVFFLLFDARSGLHRSRNGKEMFHCPLVMRDAKYWALVAPADAHRLDTMNALFFNPPVALADFVADPAMRASLVVDESAAALDYPLLGLDQLFQLYFKTLSEYVTTLKKRLAQLKSEAPIDVDEEIVVEEQEEEEEEEGEEAEERLLLKPQYDHAMRQALLKVTRECDGLSHLTLAQLQSDEARASGLQQDFVQFMAAMMAERKVLVKRATSKQQRQAVLRGTWQAMRALKQYRVRKVGRGGFKIHRQTPVHARGALF